MGLLGKPIDFAYRAVPEALKERISQALYQVLLQVREHSRDTVRRQALYDKISAAVGLDVSDPHNLARQGLPALDKAAYQVLSAHRQLAVVQGGVTGAAGLPGLVADIPSLYFLVFRCVEEIACCYGFPADSEEERDHMLKVVDVGHYLESGNKRKGMLELESMDDMLRRGAPVKDLERTVVAKGLQQLSRQLSSRLVQRKLAQTLAVVGAVIGAGVNAALVSDVGTTAIHAYRRRRLRQMALRRRERAGASAEPDSATEAAAVSQSDGAAAAVPTAPDSATSSTAASGEGGVAPPSQTAATTSPTANPEMDSTGRLTPESESAAAAGVPGFQTEPTASPEEPGAQDESPVGTAPESESAATAGVRDFPTEPKAASPENATGGTAPSESSATAGVSEPPSGPGPEPAESPGPRESS